MVQDEAASFLRSRDLGTHLGSLSFSALLLHLKRISALTLPRSQNRWHATLAKIVLSSNTRSTSPVFLAIFSCLPLFPPPAALARTAVDLSLFSPFATCLFYFSQGTVRLHYSLLPSSQC